MIVRKVFGSTEFFIQNLIPFSFNGKLLFEGGAENLWLWLYNVVLYNRVDTIPTLEYLTLTKVLTLKSLVFLYLLCDESKFYINRFERFSKFILWNFL